MAGADGGRVRGVDGGRGGHGGAPDLRLRRRLMLLAEAQARTGRRVGDDDDAKANLNPVGEGV